MKTLSFPLMIAVLAPIGSFAKTYPNVDKNVVLECQIGSGQRVAIVSEENTTGVIRSARKWQRTM